MAAARASDVAARAAAAAAALCVGPRASCKHAARSFRQFVRVVKSTRGVAHAFRRRTREFVARNRVDGCVTADLGMRLEQRPAAFSHLANGLVQLVAPHCAHLLTESTPEEAKLLCKQWVKRLLMNRLAPFCWAGTSMCARCVVARIRHYVV